MAHELIDPGFLFEFSVPMREHPLRWTSEGLQLAEPYRVPPIHALGGRLHHGTVSVAWNKDGLGIDLSVSGKKQIPWCRDGRVDESDGLHVWIDTRPAPDVHRATRFCHHFAFLPLGGGSRRDQSLVGIIPIQRARQHPNPVPRDAIEHVSKLSSSGYSISVRIGSAGLTGYDPVEHPEIRLWYAIVDRELGWQTLYLGPEYNVADDPSLWPTWRLLPAK
jgi:hypothetical protein